MAFILEFTCLRVCVCVCRLEPLLKKQFRL